MKRSKFSLSNYKLFTGDMGELIPCGLTEVLPGDTVQQATSALVRCSPLLAPVMHPVDVRIHHWYVPHRLVWDEFEDFITAGPTGTSVPDFPTINVPNVTVGQLADYLGVPTAIGAPIAVSALPFRGYAMIWNEWYRDQDLQTELVFSTASGLDATTNQTLQNVAWEKDYFTSARPWEQKGPTVTLPIGTTAPIRGLGVSTSVLSAGPGTIRQTAPLGDENGVFYTDGSTAGGVRILSSAGSAGVAGAAPQVFADLSNASSITVNALRQALALQRFEEARARYGSRYTEYLRYLGVRSSDARLQRPEYLGGGKQTIQFSEVLATAATDTAGTDTVVGELKGHGIAAMRSNRYRRFFEEHGYVFSFFSVKPKTMYAQSLARHWNRRSKEDFWQKEFEHIGQQAIKNKEVYAAHTTPEGTFGYQDRYDEYRRTESTVSGEFRNSTLDYWHMARVFASSPALNETFIKSVPTKRNFASQSTDVLYVMAKHNIQARRLVSKVGTSFIY